MHKYPFIIPVPAHATLSLTSCHWKVQHAQWFPVQVKLKVKCTLVQALRLCTGRTAHRGSRGIALLFLDHSTRRGWRVSVTPRPHFTSGKYPVPIVQEAGWAPGPVWKGAENLAHTGIRSTDRPARSQSLYRLSYPAHDFQFSFTTIISTHSTLNKPAPDKVLLR